MSAHLVAFVIALASAAVSGGGSVIGVDYRPAVDSVRVLLFGGDALAEVTVLDARVDGRRRARFTIAGAGTGSAESVQRAALHDIRSMPGGTIILRSAARQRMLQGRIRMAFTGGGIRLTAIIDRRDYLAGALAAESEPGDPHEYLIALAVLQRNYLDLHRGRHVGVDLCDLTHCQRYDAGGVTPAIRAAVLRADTGHFDVGPVCYYSVNCGGSTLLPSDVWGHDEPGYSRVGCPYCRNVALVPMASKHRRRSGRG